MASFEIGVAKHPDQVRLFSRADILADERTPLQTRESEAPESLRVQPDKDGNKRRCRPDGELFALSTASGFRFFGGIEADTGTMPVRTPNLERTSIQRKLLDYKYILEHGIYQERFNSNTFFIPFITSYKDRLDEMLSLWEETTRSEKWMRPCLPMKVHPLFDGLEKPRPTGHMLEEQWFVAGGGALDLLQ
jgi:hypothetical protein